MPRNNKIEKSKDLGGSLKKILVSLKPWLRPILVSLVLSLFSAYITIISPNKLSELTDYITAGLTPRISEEVIASIMADPEISEIDKLSLMNFNMDEPL